MSTSTLSNKVLTGRAPTVYCGLEERRARRTRSPAGPPTSVLPVGQPLLSVQTYAATAFTWSSVMAEPPFGGMMAPMAFVASAAETPWVI